MSIEPPIKPAHSLKTMFKMFSFLVLWRSWNTKMSKIYIPYPGGTHSQVAETDI